MGEIVDLYVNVSYIYTSDEPNNFSEIFHLKLVNKQNKHEMRNKIVI